MVARWDCSRNSTARRGWPDLGRRSSGRAGVGRFGSGLEVDYVGDSFLRLGMEGKDQRVPWKSFERGGERRGGRTPWMGERRHGSRSSCWWRPWEEGPWRALEGSREGAELEEAGPAMAGPCQQSRARVERFVARCCGRALAPWTSGWSAGRGGDPPSIMDPLGEGAPAPGAERTCEKKPARWGRERRAAAPCCCRGAPGRRGCASLGAEHQGGRSPVCW